MDQLHNENGITGERAIAGTVSDCHFPGCSEQSAKLGLELTPINIKLEVFR
jgi:hypothetical protein